jgi:hypothetical protein
LGTGTPGLGVKITPAGRKIFIVLYRTAGADHRAYGRVPQRVIAHRLRDCSRAGVRAASRGPISKSTNTSKVEYAGSERPGIRLSDPVAFVGVFTRRDEFFLGPLTLASLRGEFSYWCT